MIPGDQRTHVWWLLRVRASNIVLPTIERDNICPLGGAMCPDWSYKCSRVTFDYNEAKKKKKKLNCSRTLCSSFVVFNIKIEMKLVRFEGHDLASG